MKRAHYTYLALGDSYTIGESVSENERWPVQLAQALRRVSVPVADPVIIARTGWTTADLVQGITQAGISQTAYPFDLVSLLIGVNNQYRGWDVAQYRQEFRALLAQAIEFAGGRPGRVIVVSIPDWGVTPMGADHDPRQIAIQIDRFNQVNRDEAGRAGAHYVDVTPISRQSAADPSLVAADGLHPSARMYTAWVTVLLPVAQKIFAS